MAICELVQSVALQAASPEAVRADGMGAIDEPDWSRERTLRSLSLERDLTRRWIEAAELAGARIRDGERRETP